MAFKNILAAMTAATALSIGTIGVQADETVVQTEVYAGPGADSGTVGTLPEGADIEILDCNDPNFCRIRGGGVEGFASQNQIVRTTTNDGGGGGGGSDNSNGGGGSDNSAQNGSPRGGGGNPFGGGGSGGGNNNVDVGIGFSVPGFSFSFGDYDDFDYYSGSNGEACFYTRTNYNGSSFCVEAGDEERNLGQFDDEISSVEVSGGAEVLVCSRRRFGGDCFIIDQDVRNLGGASDQISSVRVR